jgi:hypothetical protein
MNPYPPAGMKQSTSFLMKVCPCLAYHEKGGKKMEVLNGISNGIAPMSGSCICTYYCSCVYSPSSTVLNYNWQSRNDNTLHY